MGNAASVMKKPFGTYTVEEISSLVCSLDKEFEKFNFTIIHRNELKELLKEMDISEDKADSLFCQLVAVINNSQPVAANIFDTTGELPPIRFIKFNDFVKHGSMPRYPDQKELAVNLEDIDRNNSILIFISHCWMRGWSGAEGWDGRPHPDNANGDKYKLCVDGIVKVVNSLANGMKECYVWLDFGCINQDGSPAGELKQLDKIVQCCDCIFTPIYDPDHKSWNFPPYGISNWYEQYQAPLWNNGSLGYVNRGWCRVEMFYAANIPVQQNTNGIKRHTLFQAGLAFHCEHNRRPHILYGTKDSIIYKAPRILPPLQNSYYDKYHPLKGSLTQEADRIHIQRLVNELVPYMEANKIVVGYTGERNEQGQKHGKGKEVYQDGSVYIGDFQNNEVHGHGTLILSYGDVYVGEYNHNTMSGYGKYSWACGDIYEGQYLNNMSHGRGKLTWANGDIFEGRYESNGRSGYGQLISNIDGYTHEGYYKDGMSHGEGKCSWNSGLKYEGRFANDCISGQGKIILPNGTIYEGAFSNGNKDRKPTGKITFSDGRVFEGDFHDLSIYQQ